MKQVAEFCKKNYPEKVKEIIKYADMFCRHEFLFNTENDLEQMDEPVCYGKKIQWDYRPANDQEYIYQFNRHRCFITLGQAYQLTGDEKYAECYVDLLTDWIAENPLTEDRKGTTWRILEAGFRGEYWTKAFEYFKDCPLVTEDVKRIFYECLHVHAEYIISMHSPYRLLSNWGVIENHGLFSIALTLPQDERTKRYLETAIAHLEQESRMAIMADGVEWEQSPMYHNEVLKCFLEIVLLGDKRGFAVPETIRDCVKRMAYANLIWQKPDHHEFMMGDSDDYDISFNLCRAAACFGDGVLKFGAKDIPDYEMAWELGIDGIRAYEAIEKVQPDFLSKDLADSGNYYFRSDWSREANLMHLHCGTLGAGHGHSDKLHIDLVVGGEDVLMDGGRFTYVSGEKRFEYKDPTMHNTITVDGKFFTICKDSWECTKLSQPVKQQFVTGEKYEFVQAGHLGYMDEGVFLNRKVVYLRPDIYVMVDECYAGAEHQYDSYYHFNEQGKVGLKADAKIAPQVTYTGSMNADGKVNCQADFYFLSDNVKLEKIKTHIARKYNHEEENETVKASWNGNGFASNVTLIHAKRNVSEDVCKNPANNIVSVEKVPVKSALKKIYYPSSMAEAIKITTKETVYIVVICHQEVNSPTDLVEVDGCLGFGNVIVFDKAVETEIGTVLHW